MKVDRLDRNTMDLAYFMPCRPGYLYLNITDQCLNNCRFCIKRDGTEFFGSDLSLHAGQPEAAEIVNALTTAIGWPQVTEIVFCGMGEPLLRYDCVVAVCKAVRDLRGRDVRIRLDTSGLVWAKTKRLDILEWIDILSISLNAETAEKYEELCRPQVPNAYSVLMDFLGSLKRTESAQQVQPFPQIRVSVVDTSEEEYIPASGREGYPPGTFPVPDIEECRRIAESFGWSLIIKKLFRDSRDPRWNDRSFHELCAQGVSLDGCRVCTYRH